MGEFYRSEQMQSVYTAASTDGAIVIFRMNYSFFREHWCKSWNTFCQLHRLLQSQRLSVIKNTCCLIFMAYQSLRVKQCQILIYKKRLPTNYSLTNQIYIHVCVCVCVCVVGFSVYWHINRCRLFNAKAIFLEE